MFAIYKNCYKVRLSFFIILLLNSCFLFAQDASEYLGFIKLNDTSLISYRINFVETNSDILGYSITDMGGAHETKSIIKGYYNKKNKTVTFKEEGIVYTKSSITTDNFCFVNFNGKIKKSGNNTNIEGVFKGLYDDDKECVSGEIQLTNFNKIFKKAERIDKKIGKSKLIKNKVKGNINLVKSLDSLKLNFIHKGEELSFFSKDEKVKFVIHDAGKEDGDKINLIVDGTFILKDYVVSQEKKIIEILLKKAKTKIKFEALNVGSISPNTVHLEIIDSKYNIQTLTNLDKGESAYITIVKKSL